ncbi:MAG: exodeoxyribonuclease VII small subunit [Clostridia bacterium]|nr:exodeoxyribonuclease VII small subunit [Clostridia bacterium]
MEKLTFEQRLDQIKGIIDGIESGQMPLEESVRQFENGMRSLNQLEKELEEMKRRITVLQEGSDGAWTETPLEEAT